MAEMYEVSERNARKYAKKCNADYYKVTTLNDWAPGEGKHLDFQKLKFLDFNNYDQILYLDSDYIIKHNAPNLFEICINSLGISIEHARATPDLAKELNMPENRYFNAGMFFISRPIIEQVRPYVLDYLNKQEWNWECQGLLNKLFYDLNVEFIDLKSNDWNPIPRCFGTYADHYAGAKKRNWGKVSY
jgi:lipopolysaccharide biosynthesis glycosyltransferase